MSKLVPCKACNKEIAKGIKKCPSCGKDQRNWFMRHKILSTLGVLIFISLLSSLGGDKEEVASEAASGQATVSNETSKEKIYKIGEVVQVDQLEVIVTKMEEFDVIGDPSLFGKKASDGGVLVALQYTMKNISKEPVGMFSYPSLNLVNEDGTKYSSDIDGSSAYATETGIDNSKILSDLNPDISVTDTQVYEVSVEKFAQGKWFIQVGDKKIQIK